MITNILLVLLIVLLGAKILGGIFSRFGLDSSIGELLTGIILGTSCLKLIDPGQIENFALIGSVLILFVAGLKQQDIDKVYKDRSALKLGIGLLMLTTILMAAFFFYVPRFFGINLNFIQAVVLGIAFSIIDVGVPAKVLISKNLIDTDLGKITIRSSIINIISGLVLFTFVTIFISKNWNDFVFKFLGIIAFFVIAVVIVIVLSKISKLVARTHIEEAEFSLAFILVIALAYFTETIGFSSILGAFIAGAIIAKMPFSETTSFSNKIKSVSFGLFVPLFFVWFGLGLELKSIFSNIWIVLIVFAVYVLIRFFATYLFMKSNKFSAPGLASASLLSVDIESLIVLIVAQRIGIFSDNIPFTLFAPSVLFSTLLIVILVPLFSRREIPKEAPEKEIVL